MTASPDAGDLTAAAEASGITWEKPPPPEPEPDWFDLWMQAGGHPDLYRRLCIAATEEDPLPDLPHEPGSDYCGVGTLPPTRGHSEYRRCTCGRWYHWTTGRWVHSTPSAHWLREHGCDPEDFWDIGSDDGPRFFEEIPVRRPGLLMLLRWLFSR